MKYPQKLSIQHGVYHDGSFYLHKIILNGRKYSGYYNKDGSLKAADLYVGDHTRDVGKRQVNIRAMLTVIGKRYVGVGTEEARLRWEAEQEAIAKSQADAAIAHHTMSGE